jgi:hypothetical protein
MPEVVDTFVQTHNWQLVRRIRNRMLNSYEGYFSKSAPNETVPWIRMFWQNISSQLGKKNKKSEYRIIRGGVRAKDFKLTIQWLVS